MKRSGYNRDVSDTQWERLQCLINGLNPPSSRWKESFSQN